MTRVITALIGIPVLIYIIKFAPTMVFAGVTLIAMLISLYEYFLLTRETGSLRISWCGYMLGSALLLSFYPGVPDLLSYVPVCSALILVAALFSKVELAKALQATAYTLFGAFYVGGLLGYLIGARMIDEGRETGSDLVLMLFVIIWACDIFAYLFGKTMGRHKLSAASPKKTVEGSVAGFVFSILAAIGCRFLFVEQISVRDAAIIGALIGITGQIGDLCESILKRSANVKDSGAILPGHGGMLDRLDSLLFAAPTMYYYFYLVLQ